MICDVTMFLVFFLYINLGIYSFPNKEKEEKVFYISDLINYYIT